MLDAATKQYVDLRELATNKGAASGYASLDSAVKVPSAQMPVVTSPVRTATVSSSLTIDAAGAGNHVDITATGNITLSAPTNGVNHQRLKVDVVASGAPRTVTFASAVIPSADLSNTFDVPTNDVLSVILEYHTITGAGFWLIESAALQGEPDSGFAEHQNTGGQAIAAGWTTHTTCSFGTANAASGLVTKATSGTGHIYTLNRTGIWAVTLELVWSSVTGMRYSHVLLSGATFRMMNTSTTTASTQQVRQISSWTYRFVAGTTFLPQVLTTNADSIQTGSRIAFVYLRP